MDSLAQHLVEQSCGALPQLYARYADMGDAEALASLFCEDGVYIRPFEENAPIVGRDQIYAMFAERAPRLGRHIVSNILVDVIDSHHATGTNYMTVMSTNGGNAPPQESNAVFVGECADEYRLTSDGWKFAKRAGMIALHLDGKF
ncbi:MAG: nuclear transport factor 2 family protein [Sphingomonadales bacterium]|nr:nuclear transport factor 2 family protein [Sphingomonadales bacterium]